MVKKSCDEGNYLSRILPEQRIYVKTGEDQTRYFKVTTKTQVLLGAGALLLAGWTIVSSSALVLGLVSADTEAHQAEVVKQAYEERIAVLRAERDQRSQEANSIQERFQIALGEISEQQRRYFELEENRAELETLVDLTREKLQFAIDNRDTAEEEAAILLAELNKVTSNLTDKSGNAKELAATLSAISDALSSTILERDANTERLELMQEKVAALEFRERINADKQERIFTQLETAVSATLDPLEKLLSTTGMDVEYLIDKVQKQYSGEGGPFIPASLPLRADNDPLYDRYAQLTRDFDRAHLMQIAAFQIPFAAPVKQTVRWTSGFGTRRDPINGRAKSHNGQDLAGPRGTPILATGDGTVSFAGRQNGYGNVIKIRHSFGYETVYAHLNAIRVETGERVSRGDVIGGMGNTGRSTGTHLHYEIRIEGKPVNPMPYMKAARNVF